MSYQQPSQPSKGKSPKRPKFRELKDDMVMDALERELCGPGNQLDMGKG